MPPFRAFITTAQTLCLIYIILTGNTNSVPLSNDPTTTTTITTTTLSKDTTVEKGPKKYDSSQSNDDNIVIDPSSNPFQGQGDDRFLDYVPPSTTSLQFPNFGSSTSFVTPVSNYGDDVFTTANVAASVAAGVTATTLIPPWMTIKNFATPVTTAPNFSGVQQSIFSPPWLNGGAAGGMNAASVGNPTLVVTTTITSSEFTLPEPTYNPNNMRTATSDDGLVIDNNLRTMMAQQSWSPPTNFDAGPTDIKLTLDKIVAHAAGIKQSTPTATFPATFPATFHAAAAATTAATPTITATFGATSTKTEPLTFFQRQQIEVESLVFREWTMD